MSEALDTSSDVEKTGKLEQFLANMLAPGFIAFYRKFGVGSELWRKMDEAAFKFLVNTGGQHIDVSDDSISTQSQEDQPNP